MISRWAARKSMLDVGNKLWQRGFVAANDGNLSVRVDNNQILATPTGVSKGSMNEEMFVAVALDGKPVAKSGRFRASSEIKMHIDVYNSRPEINAVVHAHPPYGTAFAVAGIPLDVCILPESILSLGVVPVAPYATPSTGEVPQSLRPFVAETDAVLLANHGALCLGKDLHEAYYRMETLEHTAKILHLARQLGNVNEISAQNIDQLEGLRGKYGLENKTIPCVPKKSSE